MKIAEIKEMNIEQLKKFVDEKRTEAVKIRFDISMRQAKNNREYRTVKKDIARALTIIKQLEQ
jgi:ribosomal protein L29